MKKNVNKSGFTLIELVITIALIGIVLSVAFSLFGFSNNIFRKGEQQSTVQNAARMVAMFISSEVRTAKDVTILETLPEAGLMGDYNFIYADGTDIKHRSVDGDIKIINKGVVGLVPNLKFFSASDDKLVKFEVEFILNNQRYFVDSEITPLNLVEGDIIQIDALIEAVGGSVIRYSDPIVDDNAIIRLDKLVLDLKRLNVFLDVKPDNSLLLAPPTQKPNLIFLPRKGDLGSTISWNATGASSYIVVSGDGIGTIYRPTSDLPNQIVNLTATISRGAGTPQTKTFVLEIAKLEPLIFDASTMQVTVPSGTVINHSIVVNGGNPTYVFDDSNVPEGLTLSANGVLQGTVTSSATFSVSVSDSHLNTSGALVSNSVTSNFVLTVTGP